MVLKIPFDEKVKPLNGKLPKYLELGLAYAEDGNSAKPPHLRRNHRGQNFNTKTTVKGL